MVRIYDKRGPTRLEMESREKCADKACQILATSPTKYWLFECMGNLRDFVDFVDVEMSGENISRAPLLSWWNTFIDGAEKAELQIGTDDYSYTHGTPSTAAVADIVCDAAWSWGESGFVGRLSKEYSDSKASHTYKFTRICTFLQAKRI